MSLNSCLLRRWQSLRMLLAAVPIALLAACQTAPVPPLSPPLAPVIAPPPVAVPPLVAPVVPPPLPKPPRIGLALGGGAARGFAHIGVIQVLEEAGLKPDLVVGHIGGQPGGRALCVWQDAGGDGGHRAVDGRRCLHRLVVPDAGLIRGEALARYVREQTGGRNIEQLKMPLGIVATDLDSGAAVLFQRGDVGVAVRASSAVPAVFQPVRIGTREYVDGGLVSPVPVRFARQMGAELVIAVDISSPPDGNPTTDLMKVLLQTFAIMGRSINQFELRDADVVVRPALVGVSSADFSARLKAIAAGRDAALRVLPDIRARVATLMH